MVLEPGFYQWMWASLAWKKKLCFLRQTGFEFICKPKTWQGWTHDYFEYPTKFKFSLHGWKRDVPDGNTVQERLKWVFSKSYVNQIVIEDSDIAVYRYGVPSTSGSGIHKPKAWQYPRVMFQILYKCITMDAFMTVIVFRTEKTQSIDSMYRLAEFERCFKI